ncbi:hypothetical protein D8M05_15830 [Oceanobacillus bengalensis]|uniref:C4-dicarboxylate ABC transporter n=1 Tax=Oceanobacillus bengalensis TaxID=1435466 RepID=A0A494YTT5_9BACI|nr:hypothetical protein D8M05_15830 [Oceanobacillus bengalensis]
MYANKLPRIVGLTILGISFVISLGSEMGLLTIVEGIRRNIAILVLILLASFITIPLRLSGYLEKIVSLMTMLRSNLDRAFFCLLSILFVLAPILNVGAIRVTQDLVKDIDFKPKFLTKAYVNGYLSAIVWSPYFATVAIVLYLFEVNLNSYILIGLTFGIIQIIIGYLLFHFHRGEVSVDEVAVTVEPSEDIRNLYWVTGKLFLIILVGIGLLIFLEYITPLSMLLLVSISAVVIPLSFGVLTGQMKQTLSEMKHHISNLNRSCNEIVLFLSAGILGSALENTVFSEALDTLFLAIAQISTLLFGITVILIVIFFTVIGVHQIIIVPLLITQVNPEIIGISPLALAFVFILAWGVSVALSPISATNLLVSNMLKAKWWQVGFKWNGAYVLTSTFVGLTIFIVIQLLTI